jgi:hypothetical protein
MPRLTAGHCRRRRRRPGGFRCGGGPTRTSRLCSQGRGDIGDGDVALGWEVPGLGEVFIAWPSHDTLGGSDRIVSGLRDAAGIVVVESDFSAIGPSVRGILPAAPGVQEYPRLDWPRVAKVIGAPLPYWPFALRIPALIRSWKPGAPPVTAPAIPDMDVAPLLRLAVAVQDGSPAQRVLVNLVRITQHRETESAAGRCRARRRSPRLARLPGPAGGEA